MDYCLNQSNNMSYLDYFQSIENAKSLYTLVKKTPLQEAYLLSQRYGNRILMKREDEQTLHSFKLRGAFHKLLQLSDTQRRQGVTAASAGNHAQGVALAAQHLHIAAQIVMPITTPHIKIQAVERLGAQVHLQGNSFSESEDYAKNIVTKEERIYIPPFDDPQVIIGQGTIAKEIIDSHPQNIDAVFVPIGGGGLAAGIALYIKRKRPNCQVIGVETVDSNAMKRSIEAGQIIRLDEVGLFADGTAVKEVGTLTFALCREFLYDIVLVDTDALCAAISDIFNENRSIVEPSGALALAGAKAYMQQHHWHNKTIVTINSGANINFHRLRHVSERTELTEQKEILLAVTLPEKAGEFLRFVQLLGNRAITELNYRFNATKEARLFVGVATSSELHSREQDKANIFAHLAQANIPALDLSHNEMAKIHLRHMAGGRNLPSKGKERIFSAQFPEYPGALARFLLSLPEHWNISLFHYRNHGSDFGRVLLGITVPPRSQQPFPENCPYPLREHTADPACHLFLY
jgi:threonine ammonia-lyase, biosynthetic